MPDVGYLRLALEGSAGGQGLTSILYYGNDVGEPVPWTVAMVESFLGTWAEDHATDWLLPFPGLYTLVQLSATIIDFRGSVISDNAVLLPIGETGTQPGNLAGPFITPIIAIQTVRVESEETRALKRSYIAPGPIVQAQLTSTGELTLAAKGVWDDLVGIVQAPVTVGLDEFAAVRVGRTVAPAQPAVGLVTDAALRPFVSERNSRRTPPRGF